jgi:UDP-N-acetyl-D-mannosaminuronic acid dehydrogenase
MTVKKVCIIGLGYIGLPTATILASKSFNVVGYDIDQSVVKTINQGKIHIVEPDLAALVKREVKSGRLRAIRAIEPADIFIICVPTPFKKGHKPDLSFVFNAAEKIAKVLKPGNLVILESTSPPKTTFMVGEKIKNLTKLLPGDDFYLAYCPERVLPGKIIRELVENDRIIGGINRISAEKASELYTCFVKGEICLTDDITAEMTKLVENTFRDINIAYANELSIICEELGISVWELIKLANKHPRVNVHQPGPGVGGHCIAVDPWFLVDSFPQKTKLIRTAREVNDFKPEHVISKIIGEAKKVTKKKGKVTIGCLGLTYKPDVDDFRESPALKIVKVLIKMGIFSIMVHDPFYNHKSAKQLKIKRITPLNDIIKRADLIVYLVAHKVYKNKNIICKKTIDFCGLLNS